MTTRGAGGLRLPVVFDEPSWADDLRRVGDRGRALAETTRRRLERDGVPIAELHRCQPEGPEATALPGCVKLYLDHWRLVFRTATTARGEPRLLCFALGVGHPPEGSRIPSVYETLTGGCTPRPLPEPRARPPGLPDRLNPRGSCSSPTGGSDALSRPGAVRAGRPNRP